MVTPADKENLTFLPKMDNQNRSSLRSGHSIAINYLTTIVTSEHRLRGLKARTMP
jgi:hypothetical protein